MNIFISHAVANKNIAKALADTFEAAVERAHADTRNYSCNKPATNQLSNQIGEV